jgi:hypothetical protein
LYKFCLRMKNDVCNPSYSPNEGNNDSRYNGHSCQCSNFILSSHNDYFLMS